ncbi:MAG: hypothetical protein ERJ67_07695 [Aphanocapsa feldmannii 277cV]|uniref:HEPN domain-containing protein n=1 Tax=Aphanocapsa feldmannii 277cV TaxID=2507553 RepID=A0A524RMH2_9CHRO|nr:MAG: hypothetical protein ERJ67_07695 [Aphanocapsa feldmannii 277cV]
MKQARFLAQKERKRPTQASLRRSVSASYYALFHLLVDEATRLMLSGPARSHLRDRLARAFQHSTMKQVAVEFTKKSIPRKLTYCFNQQPVQQELIDVASSFLELQEARHDADYNRARRFTRREALDFADMTKQAFEDWKQVRGSLQADTFLTGLLAYKHMQG